MIPTLDHRKVFWWGEKSSLSIIDLKTLHITEYPMASGGPGSKLITYDVMIIKQKLIYIMYAEGDYKMVYYYDLMKQDLIGGWKYSNDDCKIILENL